ncbi:spore photoproduct lyase family protein [Larkinella insperata]|uniref:Spore photoproduct lyase family protein n=1 Tax=Larkinella insperata TaxID=332158 RepID=A0ABW3QJN7_9BACT|nr:spore photoproduct lyase family protein [Larkinella insperata]
MRPFHPTTIFYTPDALNERGRQVLQTFPEAVQQSIGQHNRLPELDVNQYKIKSDVLVLGRLKTLVCRESGRSSDFVSPSLANGCFGACAYCYVDRNKPVNPITLFTNTEEILGAVDKHVHKQPWPKVPNQTHATYYTYDIGCNSDISVDAALSDGVETAVAFFRDHPRALATFATKFVNPHLLQYDPQRKTRIRFSLMPARISKLVDVRTDSIEDRLAAINDFYQAGYDVHVNFSPVIFYEGWLDDYRELFERLNEVVHPAVKAQMQSEVIFLTHHEGMHQVNLALNPKAEQLLWAPDQQEFKRSQWGGINIRYRYGLKGQLIAAFQQLHQQVIPWCGIRYIF